MKTRGLQIVEGYVMPETPQYGRGVPDQFWNRLKAHITKACLVDAYREDYQRERVGVLASVVACEGWSALVEYAEAEERLFRRWTERVVGPQSLWPWERGWTDEFVDSYLVAPATKREAA